MNWEHIQQNANQLKHVIKQKWQKLTDDDLELLRGDQDAFYARVDQRMGLNREQAERELGEIVRAQSGVPQDKDVGSIPQQAVRSGNLGADNDADPVRRSDLPANKVAVQRQAKNPGTREGVERERGVENEKDKEKNKDKKTPPQQRP